jgi:hypothetical protein
MIRRSLLAVGLLLFAWGICFSQTSFHGLTPGWSTRADVERLLGQPIKEHSSTLVEYHPLQESRARGVTKVYVQYRKDSSVVERIESLLVQPRNRADILKNLQLPEQPAARGANAAGDLQEYFGPPFYIVLTYQGADASGGVARAATAANSSRAQSQV